jgi:hypothetical protein
MASSAVPITAEFAAQLVGAADGDVAVDAEGNLVGADGAPVLTLGSKKKKKKKGTPAGASSEGVPRRGGRPVVGPPMSRAERRKLKSKERKLASLEVRGWV